MKIVFRVDSSEILGTGHLIRCLTLADALRKRGVDLSFISRELPGNLISLIMKKNFEVRRLPSVDVPAAKVKKSGHPYFSTPWEEDAEQTRAVLSSEKVFDWLIVDHYALDWRWQKQMRPYVKRIMVIDDLADRVHDCDVLLDQNLYENFETRYEKLVSPQCRLFLGPRYALLRPEFIEIRKTLRERDGTVRRILVFLGGTDPTNETEKVLRALSLVDKADIAVDVVVGSANRHKNRIERICATMEHVSFHCQVENMAALMARADLSIGAGGTTTWERCYLGLPTVTLVVSSNQIETTKGVDSIGAAWDVGWYEEVSSEHLALTIQTLIENPAAVKETGRKALWLMGKERSNGEEPILIQTLMEAANAAA